MKKITKKGFTLIELMIVLAIIAILAVALVPKAGQMKDSARNAGVTTNVNAVRGVLEAKVEDVNYKNNYANTLSFITKNFVSGSENALVNPITKGTVVAATVHERYYANVVPPTSGINSVVVCAYNTIIPAPLPAVVPLVGNKGTVYVYVYTDGYLVFGVDGAGMVVNQAIIK